MPSIDFKELNRYLLSKSNTLLTVWLPGGKKRGNEWVCANIRGGAGESFSVNMETGVWAEFNGGLAGGDLVSLYAAQNNLKQREAATILSREFGLTAEGPSFAGSPSGVWKYHDKNGICVAAVARYDEEEGKKRFTQQHFDGKDWVFKAHPEPRPLYKLQTLLASDKPVLIVEGEKTADAAERIAGKIYAVTTWMGGAQAIRKTDWSVLSGRKILLIPDNDSAGVKAMANIRDILSLICPEIKIVDPSDQPQGWDLADMPENWGWNEFKAWALKRVIKPRIDQEPAQTPIDPEIMPPESNQQQISPINVAVLNLIDQNEQNDITKRALWDSLGLPVGMNGIPINNIICVNKIFNYDENFKDKLWYDEFHKKIFYKGKPLTDSDEVDITVILQSKYGLSRMEIGTVRNAILHHAYKNLRNEPKDWITSLKWDEVDRVNSFFSSCFGTEDNEYHRAVSKYFWAGLASRIMNPGEQLNCMIVLQGKQGTFKSTSMRIIGGKWYFESCNEVGTKDFLQSLHGVLLMEIGELDSMKRARTEAIKNMLSTQIDHFRLPYSRNTESFLRQCVFVGTTNEDHFIADQTGGRRFFPISVEKINIEKIKNDREQLFAQALNIYQTDKNWWNVPVSEAEEEQEARRISDPWEDVITYKVLSSKFNIFDGINTSEIALKILGISADKMDRIVSLRITNILKRLGFRVRTTKDSNRKSIRVWSVDRHGGHLTGNGEFVGQPQWTE